MTTFFTIDEINDLVLQGHSYISFVGVKIIDDYNNTGSSILEGHFYEFLNLLEVIELRKDVETTDDCLQQLVLRLYGIVKNECVYYNGLYVDIEYSSTSSSTASSSPIGKTVLDITDGSSPIVINWLTDIVPTIDDGRTWAAKHGKLGYVWSAKWFNSGSGNYEKTDSYTMEDTYSGNNLETVTINAFQTPIKFVFV